MGYLTKIIMLIAVIFESDGLVTRTLGFDKVISGWLFAILMCSFFGLALFLRLKDNKTKVNKEFFYPLIAFAIYFSVSFISAGFIFHKPIKYWLPSLYIFTPIFIFYFLYVFQYTLKEVVVAIISVSIIISLLLFLDHYFYFEFLDSFQRRSAFFMNEGRRIVLLKNEVVFGFVAVVSMIISSNKHILNTKLLLFVASALFFIQAFIMESRMGFLAMATACVTLIYLKGLTKKTLYLSVAVVLFVMVFFPIIFSQHITSLGEMSSSGSQSNISIRFETVDYFYNLFLQTYGVGIGMMSSNAPVNNVLHLMEHYNINDAGAYSSLFQFGVLGCFMWVFFTYKCLQSYKSYYQLSERRDPYSIATFGFLFAFTFSLLPFSFFTSYSSISMGGLLLYIMYFCKLRSIK
jgi:hypothetical protein